MGGKTTLEIYLGFFLFNHQEQWGFSDVILQRSLRIPLYVATINPTQHVNN